VYIHSRFVERPADQSVDAHQVFALTNKFVACTASIFATAAGFAALMVSDIRPIHEMGLWVAVGMVFTWVIVFTLFPALQKVLQTPTEQERGMAGHPVLREFELKTVGLNPLHAKMAQKPGTHPGRELRVDGGRHLHGVCARLPQRHGATDGQNYARRNPGF
jgi:hypothetical protein